MYSIFTTLYTKFIQDLYKFEKYCIKIYTLGNCELYYVSFPCKVDRCELLKTRVVVIDLSVRSGAVIDSKTVAITWNARAVDAVVSADSLGIRTHLLARTAAHLFLSVGSVSTHYVVSVMLEELGVLVTGLDTVLDTNQIVDVAIRAPVSEIGVGQRGAVKILVIRGFVTNT